MYKYLLNQCYCILTIFFVMSYVYIIYIYIYMVCAWLVRVRACVRMRVWAQFQEGYLHRLSSVY